jgi:hypothetical protein
VQDGERARIGVDRHTERLRHAVGGDVTVGRPDPAGGEDIGVAMPERIDCVDDRPGVVESPAGFPGALKGIVWKWRSPRTWPGQSNCCARATNCTRRNRCLRAVVNLIHRSSDYRIPHQQCGVTECLVRALWRVSRPPRVANGSSHATDNKNLESSK